MPTPQLLFEGLDLASREGPLGWRMRVRGEKFLPSAAGEEVRGQQRGRQRGVSGGRSEHAEERGQREERLWERHGGGEHAHGADDEGGHLERPSISSAGGGADCMGLRWILRYALAT